MSDDPTHAAVPSLAELREDLHDQALDAVDFVHPQRAMVEIRDDAFAALLAVAEAASAYETARAAFMAALVGADDAEYDAMMAAERRRIDALRAAGWLKGAADGR